MRADWASGHSRNASLVDVLDRVLDKGLVVAGDIKVSLAEVELLTLRIRLIVCSLDKAQEIGLDWWRYDRHLSPGRTAPGIEELEELRQQIRTLTKQVAALSPGKTRAKIKSSPLAARRLTRGRPDSPK